MRWNLWVVSMCCCLMGCVGSHRLLRQSVGPGPGPGCASTLDCACKNGSAEACKQLGSATSASKASKPKASRPREPTVDPVLPPSPSGDEQDPDSDTKERCVAYYARCVEAGGQNLPGRHKKESLCGSCLAYCTSNGFWPAAIYTWDGVRRPCLGA